MGHEEQPLPQPRRHRQPEAVKGYAMNRKLLNVAIVCLLSCTFVGCFLPEPRTGNLYLSTRQNVGYLTRPNSRSDMAVALSIMLEPLLFFGTFTTAPVWDTMCFPFDCYLKITGSEFLFLDDAGRAIRWCNVSFYNDSLIDETSWHSKSSSRGYYSPGVNVNRTMGWSLAAAKSGYYPLKIGNDTSLYMPGCQVITARLDRIISPIPLYVRELRFLPSKDTPWWIKRQNNNPVAFDENGFCFSYDFLKSDWLPPWGKGCVADISFQYNKTVIGHEQIKYSSVVRTNEYCKCELTIQVMGEENGLVAITPSENAGIKIRMAPEDGYDIKSHVCLKGRVSRKKYECNYRPNAYYAFRVRTDTDEHGRIKRAFYGKIYGDFSLMGTENEITGVRFLYYLNPTPNDRNLEWDMKNNLCPQPGDIGNPRP